jgi:hypothetical protein
MHRLSQWASCRSACACVLWWRVQILKAFDQNSPEYLVGLRAAALAVVAFNTIAQMVLEWRIRRTNDKTAVKTPMNPLSMIMGGTASTQAEQTAAEYALPSSLYPPTHLISPTTLTRTNRTLLRPRLSHLI